MLVYLASYPKSGNTWVRAIIRTLLSGELNINTINLGTNSASKKFTGSIKESIHPSINKICRYNKYVKHISTPEIKYLKVHDAFDKKLFPEKVKTILIVRNPLDLVISYAHYNNTSIDKAIESINDPTNTFRESELYGTQYLSSWRHHTASWLNSDNKILLIKYEDMLDNIEKEIKRIASFLNIPYSEELLIKVQKETSFVNLKSQELHFGFREKPKRTKEFFRNGTKQQYKKELTEIQINNILNKNKEIMSYLGYMEELQ